MTVEHPPFVRYQLGDRPKEDTFTVKLNEDERAWLEGMKKVLEQPKDSTALKQLALIGSKVLLDPQTAEILGVVFKNKRNNKKTGIIQYEV